MTATAARMAAGSRKFESGGCGSPKGGGRERMHHASS
jgi:hypothetical protein